MKGKTNIKMELNKTNLDIWGHSRNGKAPSYKQRNTVNFRGFPRSTHNDLLLLICLLKLTGIGQNK